MDPTPEFIQAQLRASSNSPSYPVTIGTPQLRESMRSWAMEYLGAQGEFDVLPTIGSKELVAWLPTLLEAKTVLYPEIAYPTYLVGSMIAGAEAKAVGLEAAEWPDADLAWINSPSNPTGRVHSPAEYRAVLEWSTRTGGIVASDECYVSFPDSARPSSILREARGENQRILTVHSLSKRSNMAGYRGACIIGDVELIAKIREIRKHAGMMVPLPIQQAMAVALGDEAHVREQAERYRARRAILRPALERIGFVIEESGAGLYIWCTRDERDWESVSWFADRGIIVTPGNFYGAQGNRHIRIALTATDQNIAEVARRISPSS